MPRRNRPLRSDVRRNFRGQCRARRMSQLPPPVVLAPVKKKKPKGARREHKTDSRRPNNIARILDAAD